MFWPRRCFRCCCNRGCNRTVFGIHYVQYVCKYDENIRYFFRCCLETTNNQEDYIYTVCINKYPHVRSLSAVPNTNWMCTWFVLRLICPSTFQSSHAGISWECSWGSPEHPSATRILTGRLYRACGTRTRVLYREIQGRWFLISNIHIIMK